MIDVISLIDRLREGHHVLTDDERRWLVDKPSGEIVVDRDMLLRHLRDGLLLDTREREWLIARID